MFKKALKNVFIRKFRVSSMAYLVSNSKLTIIKRLMRRRLMNKYHITISLKSSLGKNVYFPHPANIVIGDGVKIGSNVLIYQNVTIGQNHNKYPTIGDGVIIYPNSVIIGNIIIGNNSIIGALSLVNKDVPPSCIVAGNPAKIIKRINLE